MECGGRGSCQQHTVCLTLNLNILHEHRPGHHAPPRIHLSSLHGPRQPQQYQLIVTDIRVSLTPQVSHNQAAERERERERERRGGAWQVR